VFPVQGQIVRAPWKLQDVRQIGEWIVALAKVDEVRPPSLGLACYSEVGELLWEAKTCERHGDNVYVAIKEGPSLMANTISGWLCSIDINSGLVTDRVFTK
jgi:hypothetical protein